MHKIFFFCIHQSPKFYAIFVWDIIYKWAVQFTPACIDKCFILALYGHLSDHILYGLLSGSSDTRQVRLRFRHPFVPAARNLLDNLARLGIRASEWTNHKWKIKYCENASRLRAFVPRIGARFVRMSLPRAVWVKLNCLQAGVGQFHSSIHKWGLAPSPNCKFGTSEQTTDHVLTTCPIHWAPHGA